MLKGEQSYKLLAINIDGTLLKSNGRLMRETNEMISYVLQKDVYVTLVTSRHFQSAKKVAKALKIPNLLVTHGGAVVGKELESFFHFYPLTEEKTEQVVHYLEDFTCNVRLVHQHYSIGNRKGLDSNIVGKAVLTANDPLFYPVQFVDSLEETVQLKPVSATKIDAYFTDELERKEAIKMLQNHCSEIDIIENGNNKIEVVAKGVSKLSSLKLVGQHIGVSLKDMVYIGDDISDLSIIESVGLGIAMGNAPEEVKRTAKWVTRSNNDNGVGYAVKELFRKQFALPFVSKHGKYKK